MAGKMLRGKAPLTMYRGAGGPGGGLYRGSVVDPRLVDDADRERLVADGFLEWVVRDGETFKLAEDTATGDKGDPVTVGDAALHDPDEVDNGLVNSEANTTSEPDAAEVRRADARAKLAELGGVPNGRSSDAVLVEYLVGKGYGLDEVEKADRDQLKKLVADVK